MTRLVRFFLLLRLQPTYALVIVGSCTALGIWMTILSPADLDSGLGLLVFVQMFMASSGFASRAATGHFDPLLVAGRGRPQAAAAHWLASVVPVIAGWACLVVTGLAVHSPAAVSAAFGRRAVALLIVSSLAWVAGYRLPRGAGGLAWITILIAVLLQHQSQLFARAFAADGAWARQYASVLACPFLLIGDRPYVSPPVLAAALSTGMTLLAVSCRLTNRLDVLLVERS